MPFIKDNPDGGEPLTASYSIRGPDYYITNLNHQDYTFPVDGWEWVEVEVQPLPADLPNKVRKAFEDLAEHYMLAPYAGYLAVKHLQEPTP